MPVEKNLTSPFGDYTLQRYPALKKETLRAWDAADEYLLHYLAEDTLSTEVKTEDAPDILILNDASGGLAVALNRFSPVVMTDSWLSMLAIAANLNNNGLDEQSVTLVNSLQAPADIFDKAADIVLVKLPKSLAMLEDQLHRIRPLLAEKTTIIAAGMSKHIHTSTLALFEKIIGPTTTSLARKKARLVFSRFDKCLDVGASPYPRRYKLPYQLDGVDIEVSNHAAVFSADRLDIGSRFFIQHLPVGEQYTRIVDLGCGNGVLGLMAAIKNPGAAMLFTDESCMAIDSAIENFMAVFGESREAEFLQTDCLQGIEHNSVSLVLCNPPFHQNNAVTDHIAWQMFTESRDVLQAQGELWVIGNRHLGYHAKLKHLFGSCEVVASNKKFTLLKARKKR